MYITVIIVSTYHFIFIILIYYLSTNRSVPDDPKVIDVIYHVILSILNFYHVFD